MVTLDVVSEWYKAANEVDPIFKQSVKDSFCKSQVESKMMIADFLKEYDTQFEHTAVIGGWFCNYLAEIVKPYSEKLVNYEICPFTTAISKTFNRRHRDYYNAVNKDVYTDGLSKKEGTPDLLINTSCEHMFHMWKMREKIKCNPLLILQSSNERQHKGHRNCVDSAEELADQARIVHAVYMGEKILSCGATRYMVVGR